MPEESSAVVNYSLFGYGITFSSHFYRRGKFHECDVKDCPSRIPPAEIKYVIAQRDIGLYSDRFDTRENAERAIKLLHPRPGVKYEILESVKVHGQWIIGDPTLPSDQVFFVSRKANNVTISRHQ